jgi:hypothetical protein
MISLEISGVVCGRFATPGNLENFGFMLWDVALRLISFQRFMSKDFPGELTVRGSWSWSFGWGWGLRVDGVGGERSFMIAQSSESLLKSGCSHHHL